MGNGCEHFIYAPESAFATFNTTPGDYIAIPADTAGAGGDQPEMVESRHLGACRDIGDLEIGGYGPGGSIAGDVYDIGLLSLIKTFMTDAKVSGGPTDYVHGLLYDDAAALDSFSAQIIYSPTMALSVLSGMINQWTLEMAQKAKVKQTLEFLAKDVSESSDDSVADGLFWFYDPATNTPDILLADPFTAYPTLPRALWFYDASVYRGGTFNFNPTTYVCAPTGAATAMTKFNSVSMVVNHGLDTEGYHLNDDRTRGDICPGNRDISLSFDLDWCDQDMYLWRAARANTPIELQIKLLRTAARGYVLSFPGIYLTPFALPDVSGDKSKRTISIEGKAKSVDVTNTTTGTTKFAMNLVGYTSEATI